MTGDRPEGISFRDDGNMADYYDPDHTLRSPYPEPAPADLTQPTAPWPRHLRRRGSVYGILRWRDMDGTIWKIEDMATDHLQNCLPYLRRRRWVLRDNQIYQLLGYADGAPDGAADAAQREAAHLEDLEGAALLRWVRGQPEYRAMVWELWKRRLHMRGKLPSRELP